MKKIIPEIIWIFVLSSLLGIISNLVTEKPIPFFPVKAGDNAVADSVLFGKTKQPAKQYFDKTVNYNQIIKLLDKPDVLFVDARSPENYTKGHIGNAVNIFPYMDDQQEYLNLVNELPHDKILILYCDGGACDLSHELAKTLFDFGYEQCFIYSGGWEEWASKKGIKN